MKNMLILIHKCLFVACVFLSILFMYFLALDGGISKRSVEVIVITIIIILPTSISVYLPQGYSKKIKDNFLRRPKVLKSSYIIIRALYIMSTFFMFLIKAEYLRIWLFSGFLVIFIAYAISVMLLSGRSGIG